MKKCIFFFLLFFTLLFLPQNSYAQKVSFTITPAKVEIIAKPDQTILQSFEIKNSLDPAIAIISIEPFLAKETSDSIQFDLENEDIKLNEPFFLKPNEEKTVELTIDIDLNSAQKDFYYNLFVRSEPPPTSEGNISIRNSLTVGSRIFVTVTKDATLEIKPKITLFSLVPKFKLFSRPVYIFDSADKIPVVLKIANEGKNLIKPRGKLALRGLFSNKNYSILSSNILAQSEKEIPTEPSIVSGFFLGKYTVFAEINFGQGSPTIYSSISFFVFPFKSTILIIFTVTLVSFFFRKVKNK